MEETQRVCSSCSVPLSEENTYKSNKNTCKQCIRKRSADYMNNMPNRVEYQMLANAKHRAKRDGLPFNITIEDIVIPDVCPVLGIPMEGREGLKGPTDRSPTLDKLIPELGYVKGNVRVISGRANRIKNDATLDELKAVVRWLEGELK